MSSTATSTSTGPQKSVHWTPFASKRVYYIHSCPSESDNWTKRQVRIHDDHKKVSKMSTSTSLRERIESAKKQQDPILLPAGEWETDEGSDSSDDEYDVERKQERIIGTSEQRVEKEVSSSPYTIYASYDSDSDSDDLALEELGNPSAIESCDSMLYANRPYRSYLHLGIQANDTRPVCTTAFLLRLLPNPVTSATSVTSGIHPHHKPLASYISNAQQLIDLAVSKAYNLLERTGYRQQVSFQDRKDARKVLDGKAERAKKFIAGYAEVRSVKMRLDKCMQERDLLLLETQIEQVKRAAEQMVEMEKTKKGQYGRDDRAGLNTIIEEEGERESG